MSEDKYNQAVARLRIHLGSGKCRLSKELQVDLATVLNASDSDDKQYSAVGEDHHANG